LFAFDLIIMIYYMGMTRSIGATYGVRKV